MSNLTNKVILLGNLGKDPEVKNLDGGKKVANFSIATSESYKDKSGTKQTTTTWHNIVVWEKLAEIAEKFLKKGSRILLEGKITNRSYTDKEGIKRYVTEIVCSSFQMLDSPTERKETASSEANNNSNSSGFDSGKNENDDLPF